MRITIGLFFIFGIVVGAYAQTKSELDLIVKKHFPHGGWTGVIGYVDSAGSATYTYGFESSEGKQPVSQHSAFYLASVTKSFVGLVLMEEIEKGTLSPNDTLGKWFPEFALPLRRVTIYEMANHTAAIHDVYSLVQPTERLTNEKAINLISKLDTLVYESDMKWGYSNSHYILLVEILAKELKMPVEDVFKKRIQEPFHLVESQLSTQNPKILVGRDERGKPVPFLANTLGDAGLVVTGNDMVAAGEVLLIDKHWNDLLTKSWDLSQMYEKDTTWVHLFGWFCKTDDSGRFCAYSGRGEGMQSYHRWNYESGQYFFYLCNQYAAALPKMRDDLALLFLKK